MVFAPFFCLCRWMCRHLASRVCAHHSGDELYSPLHRRIYYRFFQVCSFIVRWFVYVQVRVCRHPHAFPMFMSDFQRAPFCKNSSIIDIAGCCVFAVILLYRFLYCFAFSVLSAHCYPQRSARFHIELRHCPSGRKRRLRWLLQANDRPFFSKWSSAIVN